MKILIYILIAAALVLMIFNATSLNFDALLEGESKTAVTLILAGLSCIVLLLILLLSKKIAEKKRKG